MQTPANRLLPAVCDLAPKARKPFLRKFGVRERTLLYIAAPSVPMRALLQSYSANKPREPRRSVFQVLYIKPHLANWQNKKMCLNSTFFRYSARSPHRATTPSRGWLRVGGMKPRSVLSNADPTRNRVTAKDRTDVRGCVLGVYTTGRPNSRKALSQKQKKSELRGPSDRA